MAGGVAVLQRMHHEGHQIGNHTWNHPNLAALPVEIVRSEIARMNEAIKQAVGCAPGTVRVPYGSVSSAVLTEIKALGVASILRSVDTRD